MYLCFLWPNKCIDSKFTRGLFSDSCSILSLLHILTLWIQDTSNNRVIRASTTKEVGRGKATGSRRVNRRLELRSRFPDAHMSMLFPLGCFILSAPWICKVLQMYYFPCKNLRTSVWSRHWAWRAFCLSCFVFLFFLLIRQCRTKTSHSVNSH